MTFWYKISGFDENSGRYSTCIKANNRLNALRKYRKGLLSSGSYWIEHVDGEYFLHSSYGLCVSVEKYGRVNSDD